MEKPTILIVDDEPMIRDLLLSTLQSESDLCLTGRNADEGLQLAKDNNVDLAILDIMMPGRSGIELLADLKQYDPDISVIMITAVSDMDTAMDCIHLGAEDYILKPFNIERVHITVRNALEKRRLIQENRDYQNHLELKVHEQTEQIRAAMAKLNIAYDDTLTALVRALDAREKETGSHSERVMLYSLLLADRLGITGEAKEIIAKGSLLHDIGKVGVIDAILLKPGKLDDQEWVQMRRHPQIGYDILSGISFLKGAADFIFCHHERFDGTGYPRGLKGEQIPIGSKIFTMVDTLDAMTSDRPYRKALTFATVQEEIKRCTHTQFDPELADVFLSIPREEWEKASGCRFL
jgi:response regulator RpfG family c-di-GMP phosphodiesterase